MSELGTRGFMVIPGPFPMDQTERVARAYDAAFASLSQAQIKYGSKSTRFGGLVALEPFYRLYLHGPLLELAREHIGGAFKLSSFHARTLRPYTCAPPLHQDVKPGADGHPIVSFIFMVDDFTVENGATRFSPGSQHSPHAPRDVDEEQAGGLAGSLLIFDGATWHEHGANRTDAPRRSVQGAFVSRDHTAAVRWSEAVEPEQAQSLPAEARSLLGL